MVSQNQVMRVMQRFESVCPHPRCELYYHSPFQLLISVVLSAQTTDKAVNRCTREMYDRGLTPKCVLEIGQDKFLQQIRSIGLAPTKAKHVLALSEQLLQRHDGQVPDTYEHLIALPGVGRKTAHVVLAELYQKPVLAVDTHVFRVGSRLGWHQEKNVEKAEYALTQIIPTKYLPRAHHWLILHGRYVCRARSPNCRHCEISDLCPSAHI